jgi:mRNA-degrading endonuclease RelE of RelBE toxin-antitoxin system
MADPYRGKKLKGRATRFSLRLGRDYRLVYSVYSHERLIDFEFVGDRKEAYRWIRHQ